MQKRLYIIISICLSVAYNNFAQSFFNEDWIYQPFIKTVKIIPAKATTSLSTASKKANTVSIVNTSETELLPLATLGGGSGEFIVTFDDMRGEIKRFRYKVELCNADWTTSNLSDMEYIEGFSDDLVADGELSLGVSSNYTNYRFSFPSANMKIKKSGNYMLHIYEDNSDKTPILSRRFLIIERLVSVAPNFTPTGSASKSETHHEFDFTVDAKYFTMSNPRQELKAVVLQNGRWDNAKKNIPPFFVRGSELLFDYQDSIVFPAGKEFRNFDIRSLNYRRFGVNKIVTENEDDIQIILAKDSIRPSNRSLFFGDINGTYIIDNLDLVLTSNLTLDPNNVYAVSQGNALINPTSRMRSEYANVLFRLKSNVPFDDADVYVMGKIFDWQLYPENKMIYDEETHEYLAEVSMKQGYYNYGYAVVPRTKDKYAAPYNISEVDGDWYETENEYTVLLYYRPQGGRNDRIIGIGTLNSVKNRK
jgi:Domain of unknown function (DUF5103)